LEICETNPHTGECLSAPLNVKQGHQLFGLVRSLAANETATFSVFVQSSAPVEFDPDVNRINVRFTDFSNCFTGFLWGATSVAVRTQP
jgi:hypothetical protein